METLKNFVTGIVVVISSILLVGIIFLTWPILLGLSSIFLAIIALVLFIIFIFYIIVLIGYLARILIFGSKKGN